MKLAEYLDRHLPEIGFAADIGASDGQFNSNTIDLEHHGWTVLCVEPNPKLAEAGRARRKLWVQAACGSAEGLATFTYFGWYPYARWSAVQPRNDYDGFRFPAFLWRWFLRLGRIVVVEQTTLDRILKQHAFPRLDLLCLDVEGAELDVLAGLHLTEYWPAWLVAEAWNEKILSGLICRLSPLGYHLDSQWKHDFLFVNPPRVERAIGSQLGVDT